MLRCGRPSLGGDDAPNAELARELTDQSLGCAAHWCRYEWLVWLDTRPHSLWLKNAPYVSFLNECVQLFRSAPTLTSSRSSNTSRRWSTRPSTRRSRRAGSSSRPARGSKTQTAPRRRCAPLALAPPCMPAAETRARSRVRRASRHASAGASLSPPPNKWCLAQSGSQPLLESKLWLMPWKLAQRTLRRCWRRFSALRRDWSLVCVDGLICNDSLFVFLCELYLSELCPLRTVISRPF